MRTLFGLWLFVSWHHMVTPAQLQARNHTLELAFDQRAIAAHQIPPGAMAMCDRHDEIIGFWTSEGRQTYYENNMNRPVADCR
jgi:hypothetical protein